MRIEVLKREKRRFVSSKNRVKNKKNIVIRLDPDALEKRMEHLDRGLVAMQTKEGVFLSWRLFCTEDPVFGIADTRPVFYVKRDGHIVAEIHDRTNWLDPEGKSESSYTVCTKGGEESASSGISMG